jgi:hypothetical protein
MNISEADAKIILGWAAETEWNADLEEADREVVDKIIAAFPRIEVPSILQ